MLMADHKNQSNRRNESQNRPDQPQEQQRRSPDSKQQNQRRQVEPQKLGRETMGTSISAEDPA
jgi:hypothetical protein